MYKTVLKATAICVFVIACAGFSANITVGATGGNTAITLPQPDKSGGMPLMQAMNERRSNRSISSEALGEAELSNLLWSAWGINRPDGRRTIPTARNQQQINLYVALESGVWLYDAKNNTLQRVLETDARAKFGGAPVHLVYTAPDDAFSLMHVGSMYQNVGLYCASAGLANVVKANGTDVLANSLPLPAGYKIHIIHSVGKPG